MKQLSSLLILSAALFVSCQTRAESPSAELEIDLMEKTSKIEESKLLILPTPGPKLKFDIHSKVGIVEIRGEEKSCLRTKNGNLAEKIPISIITFFDDLPQKVLTATVEKKLEESCARPASETGDKNPGENFFYSLILDETEGEEISYDLGIGIIQPTNPIQIQNKLAKTDLNGDGKPEFFRLCQGFEGFYFTIWTGQPLKGKKIWDSFFYVNYDTVPTCKKKDLN